MASPVAKEDWEFHLRSLSTNARDSGNDPASDPSLLQSVTKICEICNEERSEELIVRVYPVVNKLFQRCVSALPQSRASNGLLLLTILQFFLDFGEIVLHDTDPNMRSFFRSCLTREFADPAVAEATLGFVNRNRKKIQSAFPTLLPQFFPLLLKLIAWHGDKLEESFVEVLPGLLSPTSFLPLFPSLVDLPTLVVALEKVEKNSGTLIGNTVASIQKSAAPEMLLALMDEAYTGSAIEDTEGQPGSDDNSNIDVADPMFLDLLKDENDGLTERHWTSPAIVATLQAAVNSTQSDRLKKALKMTPGFLDLYFALAMENTDDSLICALIPLLMSRNSTLFPDKVFSFEVRKRLSDFILAAFQRSPSFIALLKKPITDRLGEASDSQEKTELALHLCWAIGEYGVGGKSHNNAARELFESLELLLYENLSSSRLGLRDDQSRVAGSSNGVSRKTYQARLLSFVVTAIAKIATHHRELLPRAHVCLSKVARTKNADRRVWSRACDYLGLMNDPAICLSVLGPASSNDSGPGIINWREGGSKIVSHIPFYILREQEGPPFHDFSISDILPAENTSQI